MSSSVRESLASGCRTLEKAGVDSPRLSTELLLAHVFGCSRVDLHLDIDRLLTTGEATFFRKLLHRRSEGEPVAYLVGSKEFYGLEFKVTPDVLIPRPETEHIIDFCESEFRKDDEFLFTDFGTGSGILAVTLAHLFPHCRGVAVDLSLDALTVARENAVLHGVDGQLQFVQADFRKPLIQGMAVSLVVSNPPYVTYREYEDISDEVREFEPCLALTSGREGLAHIQELLPQMCNALCGKGIMMFEFGWRQGDAVKGLLLQQKGELTDITIHKDYSGHDRVAFARKNNRKKTTHILRCC